MSKWHPRIWVETLPDDFNDATSFRHMRRFAQAEIDNNMRIRAEVVAENGEEVAVEEWDSAFEADNERCREAIGMIDAKMLTLGIPL